MHSIKFQLDAVIFDRDGVLIDTEPVYVNAYNRTLRQFGSAYEYKPERRNREAGIPTKDVMLLLMDELNITGNVDDLLDYYRNVYQGNFEKEGVRVFDGAIRMIEKLQDNNIPIAIGTGSSHKNNEITLSITGLDKYFSVVVGADDVANGKPDPETFVKAAHILNVEPENCVVIGDSDNDRLGAKNGGMKFVLIS